MVTKTDMKRGVIINIIGYYTTYDEIHDPFKSLGERRVIGPKRPGKEKK